MKPILGIDIENFSPVSLPKAGVYRYVDTDEFEILLFSYAYDDEPVQTIDLACGEKIPDSVLADLENPDVIKTATTRNLKGCACRSTSAIGSTPINGDARRSWPPT